MRHMRNYLNERGRSRTCNVSIVTDLQSAVIPPSSPLSHGLHADTNPYYPYTTVYQTANSVSSEDILLSIQLTVFIFVFSQDNTCKPIRTTPTYLYVC